MDREDERKERLEKERERGGREGEASIDITEILFLTFVCTLSH